MKLKRIMSALLAALMLAGTLAVGTTASEKAPMAFDDVKESDWFYDNVEYVYENDLMQGKSESRFDPKGTLNRAEFITILGRLAGASTENFTPDTFPDTDKNTWYSPYVGWAVENGVVLGYNDGTFRPTALMSRQEIAVSVTRYVTNFELRMTQCGGVFDFNDKDQVADWAADSIATLRNSGVVMGDQNRNFKPKNGVTRAETATIIRNMREAIENAWTGYLPEEDEGRMILGASYLYWNGSAVAGGMEHTLNKDGEYPILEAYMNSYTANNTYVEPNTVGLSINYLNIDIKETPIVKIAYTLDGMPSELSAVYYVDTTKTPEYGPTPVNDALTLTSGADDAGVKTATLDLSVINDTYNINYETSIANLLFSASAKDYDGEGKIKIAYVGFFKTQADADGFTAAADAGIDEYLKTYEPYTKIDWNEYTEEDAAYYDKLLSDRIGEIKNSESEITPDMFDPDKTYYISSINGDDNNDGKTPETAWKSLSKLIILKAGGLVEESAVPDGGAVFFERGSEFYPEKYHNYQKQTLAIQENISVGAYGEGEKPAFYMALDFSESDDKGVWLKTEYPNVWKLDPTLIDKDPEWRTGDRTELSNIIFNGGEAVGIRIISANDKDDIFNSPFGEGVYSYDKGYVCNGFEYFRADSREMANPGTALKNNLEFTHDSYDGQLYLYWDKGNPADYFDEIKVARNGFALGAGGNIRFDNIALLHSATYGATVGGENIHFSNCEVGFVGGSISSIESGIEIFGETNGVLMTNNYIHDVMDGPITSQNAITDQKITIQNLEYSDNVIVSSGNGAEIWNHMGPLDENGIAQNKMINLVVKDNIMAYIGYGITQTQDTGKHAEGNIICGSMYGEISSSIVENNIFLHWNGQAYGSYMATYEQPRGWQAKGNTYVANPEQADLGYCYETINYINHNMWKRARITFPYTYETVVWYTNQGIDPTGKYFYYDETNEHERERCFFTTGYWIERGGFELK